jgi:hypothetical protein
MDYLTALAVAGGTVGTVAGVLVLSAVAYHAPARIRAAWRRFKRRKVPPDDPRLRAATLVQDYRKNGKAFAMLRGAA